MFEEMQYDGNKKQYFITREALLNNRGVTEKELKDGLGDVDKALKDFSSTVYRYIFRYYRGEDKSEHQKEIRHLLDSSVERRNALKEAIIEYTMGALISELDLNKYLAEGSVHLPDSVHDELSNAGLLRRRIRYNTIEQPL